MSVTNILSLLGGLALFLYGMNLLGASLEKCAGNRLKSILAQLTTNPLNGFLLGVAVTAVIQSSSATTVMVVGFVNSGLMTLSQSISVIIGANVGTAVTSWILSLTGIEGNAWYITMLKPTTFTPVIAFFGIIVFMTAKRQRRKDASCIALGFAILMFGMEMMSDAVRPLANIPEFTQVLVMFSNPILGVLAGTVLTAIIQSSSASVGILQALSLTGSITYASAIPIIMGQNIGTCITALLSSIGTTRDAKRASMVHLYFNVIGTVFWLIVYYAANSIFQFAFASMYATPFGIAIVHTTFKLLCTALIMPFSKQLERLAYLSVPDGKDEAVPLLDERLFVTPPIALARAHSVLLEMADLSCETLFNSLDMITNYDAKIAQSVLDGEDRVDFFEDKLGTYLVKLSGQNMGEYDSRELTKYLHILSDYERISDHAINILASAQEKHDKEMRFSDGAWNELSVLTRAVREIMTLSLEALKQNDLKLAAQVEPLEEVIDLLNKTIRGHHVSRLTRGECTIELGFVLNDLITNLERVSDHCSNIAVCAIEIAHNSFETHEYLHDRAHSEDFKRMYEDFRRIYTLN